MPFPMLRLSRMKIDASMDWRGYDILNIGVIQGRREIITTEEVLVRQRITPTEVGAEALIVTDTTGTLKRIIMREDGSAEMRLVAVGDIMFSNGCKFVETEKGIALLDKDGEVIVRWQRQ